MRHTFLLALCALALAACVGSTTPTSTVKGIGIVATTNTIAVGDTVRFTAIMQPPDLVPGGVAAIQWTSTNTAVATVAGGLVRGVSAGQAAIIASAGGYQAAAAIRVLAP